MVGGNQAVQEGKPTTVRKFLSNLYAYDRRGIYLDRVLRNISWYSVRIIQLLIIPQARRQGVFGTLTSDGHVIKQGLTLSLRRQVFEKGETLSHTRVRTICVRRTCIYYRECTPHYKVVSVIYDL